MNILFLPPSDSPFHYHALGCEEAQLGRNLTYSIKVIKVSSRKLWLMFHTSWYFRVFRKNAISSSTPFLSIIFLPVTILMNFTTKGSSTAKVREIANANKSSNAGQEESGLSAWCLWKRQISSKHTYLSHTNMWLSVFDVFQSKIFELAFPPQLCTHT